MPVRARNSFSYSQVTDRLSCKGTEIRFRLVLKYPKNVGHLCSVSHYAQRQVRGIANLRINLRMRSDISQNERIPHFAQTLDYLGLNISAGYIASANALECWRRPFVLLA